MLNYQNILQMRFNYFLIISLFISFLFLVKPVSANILYVPGQLFLIELFKLTISPLVLVLFVPFIVGILLYRKEASLFSFVASLSILSAIIFFWEYNSIYTAIFVAFMYAAFFGFISYILSEFFKNFQRINRFREVLNRSSTLQKLILVFIIYAGAMLPLGYTANVTPELYGINNPLIYLVYLSSLGIFFASSYLFYKSSLKLPEKPSVLGKRDKLLLIFFGIIMLSFFIFL